MRPAAKGRGERVCRMDVAHHGRSASVTYDRDMRRSSGRALVKLLAVAVPALAVATVSVRFLEEYVGVANASAGYLAAVVVVALVAGTSGAIVAAAISSLLYDFVFVTPRFTFTVADPGEWLNIVLLLFVGIVVGQLVAIQRSRTE